MIYIVKTIVYSFAWFAAMSITVLLVNLPEMIATSCGLPEPWPKLITLVWTCLLMGAGTVVVVAILKSIDNERKGGDR